MQIIGKNVMLRDFEISDLQDHIRWHEVDTEWMEWDSPWRQKNRIDPKEYAERRLAGLRTKSDDDIRWTFEICTYPQGEHIGWTNCYCLDMFYNYSKNLTSKYALGIDIVPQSLRGRGLGKEVFQLFQNYLLEFGITKFYTQTWEGNTRMQKMATSLGYERVNKKRKKFSFDGKTYDIITYRLEI